MEGKNICKYNHQVCTELDPEGIAKGGSAIVILTIYKNEIYILLGFDTRKKLYSIVTGKRESNETCYREIAERELYEEFKIILPVKDEKIRYKVIKTTPVFYNLIPHENINIDIINDRITEDNKNPNLPSCYKEMDHVKLFKLYDRTLHTKITKFTHLSIKSFYQFNKEIKLLYNL